MPHDGDSVVRLRRALTSVLQSRLDEGGLLKLKHAFPRPKLMARALFASSRSNQVTINNARIVVVGLGTASIAFLKALRVENTDNVTIVAKDEQFGGKCVNYGCMPVAFALAHAELSPDQLRAQIEDFVSTLRLQVESDVRSLGFPIVMGELDSVDGKQLRLVDGRRIAFDVAVIGIGSDEVLPRYVDPGSTDVSSIEALWTLARGSRITIYAENNIAALSLAAAAEAIGLLPTVLMVGANPFAALPSFRYFVRQIKTLNIVVHSKARLLGVDRGRAAVSVGGKRQEINHDKFITASRPSPRFVPIDGRMHNIFDVDVFGACVPKRPDVLLIGEAGGYFTATEAEAQAKLVAQSMNDGTRADLSRISRLPLVIDGRTSLAMFGKPWTIGERDWHEIDFRTLGWSKIGGHEGKVWYLLDRSTGRLDGLHICHPLAKDLSNVAQLLFEQPVTAACWHLVGSHPSSAEIFKVLAMQAVTMLKRREKIPLTLTNMKRSFRLPSLDDLSPAGPMPDWLTSADAAAALTSPSPRRSLAMLFGIAQLGPSTLPLPDVSEIFARQETGQIISVAGISITFDKEAATCKLVRRRDEITVSY